MIFDALNAQYTISRQCDTCSRVDNKYICMSSLPISPSLDEQESDIPIDLEKLISGKWNDGTTQKHCAGCAEAYTHDLCLGVCKCQSTFSEKTTMTTAAGSLVISLNRTQEVTFDGTMNRDYEIKVPEQLNIPMTDGKTTMYILKAVVSHLGANAEQGHYVAEVKYRHGWYKCDDVSDMLVHLVCIIP
jgi:ubiquitin C-terminal hydrolase